MRWLSQGERLGQHLICICIGVALLYSLLGFPQQLTSPPGIILAAPWSWTKNSIFLQQVCRSSCGLGSYVCNVYTSVLHTLAKTERWVLGTAWKAYVSFFFFCKPTASSCTFLRTLIIHFTSWRNTCLAFLPSVSIKVCRSFAWHSHSKTWIHTCHLKPYQHFSHYWWARVKLKKAVLNLLILSFWSDWQPCRKAGLQSHCDFKLKARNLHCLIKPVHIFISPESKYLVVLFRESMLQTDARENILSPPGWIEPEFISIFLGGT